MFSPSERSPTTHFAERASIVSRPHCANCNLELPKKGTTVWFSKSQQIPSFWLIHCPCGHNHIVFNSTAELPNPHAQ